MSKAESMAPPKARRVIRVPGLPAVPGASDAVAAGGWLFGGGVMAGDARSGLDPSARARPLPWSEEPLGAESRLLLDRISKLLEAAGCDIRHDLIRLWQWIVASYPSDQDYAAGRMIWPAFPDGTPYARNLAEMVADPMRSSTGIGVRQLPIPDAMIAVDFLAIEPGAGIVKQGVDLPPDLPRPRIGYSPATRHGDWVFLAGFGATDFNGDWGAALNLGEPSMIAPEARINPYIWLGSPIEAQTDYTLRALARIAEAAGTSLDRCVKADVTIAHPSDFAGMDRVWRRHFPDSPPARNVVTGARLVIKGLRVEIALLLLSGESRLAVDPIHLENESPIPGHAPHAVHAGDFLFTSGLLPVGADGGVPDAIRSDPLASWYRDSAAAQADHLAGQLARICEAAGASLSGLCKIQAFLADMAHLRGMMRGWKSAFPDDPPAISAVAMGGDAPLLAPGALLQWDAIGYAPRRA
jgi:enamine deaminase RidA (YjgF/YER057c/UK114 family)